jgi:outer membrane autotransporter protein
MDGYLGTGYDFKCKRFTFGPVASVQYTYVGIHSYDESGSLSPLHLEYNDANSLQSMVGARVAYDIPVKDVILRPQIKAGWQHEFLDTDHAITSRFASGAGYDFTVHSTSIGRDSLALSGGMSVQWCRDVSTYVYYDGELARKNSTSHTLNVGVALNF